MAVPQHQPTSLTKLNHAQPQLTIVLFSEQGTFDL